MFSVPISPNDVEFLVCPRGRVARLRRSLPSSFGRVPILSYTTKPHWRGALSSAIQWVSELRKVRDRVQYVADGPSDGYVLLPLSGDGSGEANFRVWPS